MTRATTGFMSDNNFKLGIFAANCSGGLAMTNAPERWDASWGNNLKLAKMADEAGIDFMLPLARWVGYGGETDFQGFNLEATAWASGLLAATERLTVFSTVHTAFTHPVAAAKQYATADHIGGGRFGLNVVCGWNKPEYDMFGLQLPSESNDRYAYGQEWIDIIKKIWSSDKPFDWDGKYFQLKNVKGNPKPVGGRALPILNAGTSGPGREYAARNSDYLFTGLIPGISAGQKKAAELKTFAREKYARDVGLFTLCYVVCRPTEKEARDYHEYYANEHANWPAVDRLMELQGLYAGAIGEKDFPKLRSRFAGGHGAYPLVGTPEQIAGAIEKVYNAGFAGTTIAFANYLQEFPYFRDEVMPLLQAKGLRSR